MRKKFPVGRRRLEPLGILVFSIIMVISFLQILQESVKKLLPGGPKVAAGLPPTAIGALAATIVIKGIIWFGCIRVKTTQVQALAQGALPGNSRRRNLLTDGGKTARPMSSSTRYRCCSPCWVTSSTSGGWIPSALGCCLCSSSTTGPKHRSPTSSDSRVLQSMIGYSRKLRSWHGDLHQSSSPTRPSRLIMLETAYGWRSISCSIQIHDWITHMTLQKLYNTVVKVAIPDIWHKIDLF